MALNGYLTLTGQKQGDIKGSVTQKGREGSLEVIAVSHEVVSPRDPASGLPTGKRMHKPYTVTTEVDQATPLLYSALVNNENITKWTLNFWRPNAAGIEKNYYRVELANGSISSISMRMLNNRNPENMKYAPFHETAFTYQRITWTILDPTTISTTDDWLAPVAG
jgi:type VI secretion system secreted protein Hcp